MLVTDEEAPAYLEGLERQMCVAQTVLNGLGYRGVHFHLLRAEASPSAAGLLDLDARLQSIARASAQIPSSPARFAVAQEKRSTLDMALDHLITQAPATLPESIALPALGSPFGSLSVNADTCTLCLSCVSACPASALQDNPDRPQLKFIEKNCVQ